MTDGYDPAEHYDRVTEAWSLLLGDELHYGVFEAGDEPLSTATANLTRRMIDAADLTHGLRVLDVGCGSGAPACRLAAEFGVDVVGITTSEVGVAAARERAAAAGLRGVTFVQRDGTDNRFPDSTFDRVWVLESAHLMRERERLIAECARVLRPGGRLVLCDLIRHREIPFAEVRERRAEFLTLRVAFGDAHFEPLAFYVDAAASQGLAVDTAEDLTTATLATFDRWRANARAHSVEVSGAIGPAGLAAFERSCEILEAFWRDATFGYGLLAAGKPDS
ncbi:MAG: SAM-dependent methyltransferase [Jatrophihabitantaceae bacterium]